MKRKTSFQFAGASDFETLLAMMREFYAQDGLRFDESVARRALQGLIHKSDLGYVFLIKEEGEVAGYAVLTFGYSLEFHGRDAFVDELYLRDEYRGKGIGKYALEFLSAVCAESGVRALHLEVERHNTNAQRVYRKFGFEDHDRYLMTKWIEPNDADPPRT
jgi:ribosomal protein S18 acetylase RimI-like enzyme